MEFYFPGFANAGRWQQCMRVMNSINKKVKDWIDLSLDDIQSAKILYRQKKYRASVLFFQQSSEKANKAMAFFHGELTDGDIRKVSHDQLGIYQKTISKFEKKINQLSKQVDLFPKNEILEYFSARTLGQQAAALDSDTKVIDKLRGSDLQNISLRNINAIVKSLHNLKNVQIQVPKNLERDFNAHLLIIVNWLARFENEDAKKAADEFLTFLNDKRNVRQFYNAIIKNVIPKMIDFGIIIMTLFYCALLTHKHFSISRYPDSQINPMSYYKINLPLVKRQLILMEFLENALVKFRTIVVRSR
jgi:HEPN domain-containing protein